MFCADLHVHSEHSYDTVQSVDSIPARARACGLDAVAVTDHDTFSGSRAVPDATDEVMIVPGAELRTEEYDDLLALFVDGPIETRRFEDAVDRIHDRGGLAVLPHPYRKFDTIPEWVLDSVDAVEGLNARSKQKWNQKAARLGNDHGLPLLGGSDAHTKWEIGRAYSAVRGDVETPAELREQIRAGAVEPRGTETPYLPAHGVSVAIETIKAGVERLR